MKNSNYIAIIPARSGSKGIAGKNIKMLGGFPLLAYSIAAAQLSRTIDQVLVSTDAEEIAVIARRFGARTPFLRPAELAGDSSSDLDFMLHALRWFSEHEPMVPEYWVHLRPTTPLRTPDSIDAAIEMLVRRPDATSLRSAHQAPESPYKWFQQREDGLFSPLMTGVTADAMNAARQSFPAAYVPDGYVDVLKASFIESHTLLHGDRVLGFISPPCIEIDSPEDFEYAAYQLKKNGSILQNHLQKQFSTSGA